MRTKTVLLTSVSAIATAAAATGPVQAQDAVAAPAGYTFSVTGGALFSAPDSYLDEYADDKMGNPEFNGIVEVDDMPMDIGYTGAFTLGKQIDDNWGVEFGASVNKLLDNSGSLYTSGGSSHVISDVNNSGGDRSHYSGYITDTSSFGSESFDFSVGYTPTMDSNFSVRLFAGIRALHFTHTTASDADLSVSGSSYGSGNGSSFSGVYNLSFNAESSLKSEFFGAGPRVGVAVGTRFEGTNFGLSGSLSGTAAYGRQTDVVKYSLTGHGSGNGYGYSGISGSSYSGGSSFGSGATTSGSSANKLVVDLQAQAGVDYYLDDSSVLTFGYQAEQMMNVGAIGDDNLNKLTHGPFVKLTGGF